ncbi:MAG: VCBS repeat-containing protein, partial [Bacteroidota bacterium]
MNFKLSLLLIFFTPCLMGQTFTEILRPAPFTNIREGATAFADVDGDNDLDVLISGNLSPFNPSIKLYLNDGEGRFTEAMGTSFEAVYFCAIEFFDMDGDDDPDVLISGQSSTTSNISKLYVNDGTGNFTEIFDTPFEPVTDSAIASADIDGDDDIDILLSGNGSSGTISKLYLNDGLGNFVESTETPFVGVKENSIAFADVDGDNDQDVLITGQDMTSTQHSKLYINDGNGVFTEVINAPFEPVRLGSIAFADIDRDNDQDVLITGLNNSGDRIAKLYSNNGSGTFTEVIDTDLEPVRSGDVGFGDIDGDNDYDLIITGSPSFVMGSSVTKLYVNDGEGAFTEVLESPLVDVNLGTVVFADVNSDNNTDILITGLDKDFNSTTNLYTNVGSGKFIKIGVLEGIYFGSITFSDVDGDNDQDLVITGRDKEDSPIAKLYLNNGNGIFSERVDTPFDGVEFSDVAFGDIDGDGDQDILIIGQKDTLPSSYVTKLYKNGGEGDFTEVEDIPFEAVTDGTVDFQDFNGDNYLDVLITGESNTSNRITELYINDGEGNFTALPFTNLPGVVASAVAFADVDGDNDQDIMITGINSQGISTSALYFNNGIGVFPSVLSSPFPSVYLGSVAFADIDGDGDQDLLLNGRRGFTSVSQLYRNNGLGAFTEIENTPFPPLYLGEGVFTDIDNDDDPDILLAGTIPFNRVADLYLNDGTGVFTRIEDTPFEGVNGSSIGISDLNGDNFPDVLIAGFNGFNPIAQLYANDGITSSSNQ